MTEVDHERDCIAEARVTLETVAQACGVGKSTVSRAFNDDPRIKAATRERVLAVAQELGYSPAQHQAARRLVLGRYGRRVLNHVVSTVFPHYFHQSAYFLRISHGMLNVLTAGGYVVLQVLTEHSDPALQIYPEILSRGEVDGMLMAEPDYRFLQRVQADVGYGNRPVVSVLHEMPGCANVVADDQQGAYLATCHLLELGHRHIMHFYAIPTHPIFHRRAEGMAQAMHEWGLDPAQYLHPCAGMSVGPMGPSTHMATPSEYLHWPNADYFASEITRFMEVLRAAPEITAIFALNDAAALHIWQILTDAGLCVPDDYSLVGFDDVLPRVDAQGAQLVTTVRVPLEAIGARAAEVLLELIAANSTELPQITLPVEFIPGTSTARVPAR